MARQDGIISLSGKLGDVIFSKRNGKRHAKAKSTKPMNQTEATKKSSVDFGEASKVGARMRRAFVPLIKTYGDVALISRFTQYVLGVFKTIPLSFVGPKMLGEGDMNVFWNFQFNAWVKLDTLLHKQPKIKLEPSGLKIEFKENSLDNLFRWVAKADAVVLQLMVYNLNLDGDDDEVVCIKDLLIPLDCEYFRGAKLHIPLNLIGEQVLCVALGIHFLQENGMIGDRTKRAAAIIYVARLRDGVKVLFVPDEPVAKQAKEDEGLMEWELG